MVLSVRSLTVRKGRHTLLENVSFNVEPGRVLGLYGPSGAGKSITLLTICGLQDHAFTVAGQIWYAGREVSNLPTGAASMLGISIMLQGLWLFPDKTVMENVAYPLERAGCRRKLLPNRLCRSWKNSTFLISPAVTPTRLAVGSNSGRCWRVRWSMNQNCFCSMSLSRGWNRNCAINCLPRCGIRQDRVWQSSW